ncbi:MAG: SOS response-associated peptidase [Lachnospiraceae bacterium]|nr:SOS response-associated peptidase [Lachnospiraceae bacterium]
MCGVFYIDRDSVLEARKFVTEVDHRIPAMDFSEDIHPTDPAPVIIGGRKGLELSCQRWGYPGYQKSGVIFNARAESVQEKKLFQSGIRYHRAVIPAKHFYEWNALKEKNLFSRVDGKVLYLAGFFDLMENEERFVILTTGANEFMYVVHDRMPLVLEEPQIKDWILDDSSTEKLLCQVPGDLKRQVDFEQMTLFAD